MDITMKNYTAKDALIATLENVNKFMIDDILVRIMAASRRGKLSIRCDGKIEMLEAIYLEKLGFNVADMSDISKPPYFVVEWGHV